MARIAVLATSVVLAAVAWLAVPAPASAARAITDGNARFEVITPSLVRLEYAADGSFEDRSTQTTYGRLPTEPDFRTSVEDGERVIRTSKLTLRWRRDAEGFGEGSLVAEVGKRTLGPEPGPNPAPLGGWRRSLDLTNGPVPLHEGVLSREGWYLLDDSQSALYADDGFATRPEREGTYQDLYLFAYGRDYARALRDLRKLTGAAPLLPRKAFGVWFSRWWPYGADDWQSISDRFREEGVPLDTISLDTDFKSVHDDATAQIASSVVGAPGDDYSWNGWDWNRELYPDPKAFFDWARERGLEVGLNIHPSISSSDPLFAETQERAGGGLTADDGCRVLQADPQGLCMVFDWTDPRQLDAYLSLHESFERDGSFFWWLDWCCDASSADAPGLTADTWINRHYAERQRARGSRWPAFSRIGGSFQAGNAASGGTGALAEHRYSIHFTGDTCANWDQLAFASEFTASEAAIGMPYVSHDIGTFHSESPTNTCDATSPYVSPSQNALTPEMYVRWVQLGTFQPFSRLHSHHGERLPWDYPPAAEEVAAEFLRLRGTLVPYIYGLARQAHDKGLPIARPLYLHWPKSAEAYDHPSQYTLGRDVLVAPVAEPGDPAEVRIWLPPGTWIDWFTGKRYRGDRTITMSVPLARMPVFVRAGAVVPTQPELETTPEGPAPRLVLRAFHGDGGASLYDDSGTGFAYERGRFSSAAVEQKSGEEKTRLLVGPAEGSFAGAPKKRRYDVELVGVEKPGSVRVDGRATKNWSYDADSRTVTIKAGRQPTDAGFNVVVADY
jgi:alpha-glucosidase (family GH31 glycosyl hydrolase)